jgi:hypothetical protein
MMQSIVHVGIWQEAAFSLKEIMMIKENVFIEECGQRCQDSV